ncbi:MAG: aminoacyl-tRNA hydrolase [Parcubacteria group bacterium]|jgi:PTH1 family peptidyl-tRNA hydrolase
MKIICGLGNPGTQYHATRHNVGFLFLDRLAEHLQLPSFDSDKKHNALVSEGHTSHKEKMLLVKPQTFMNRSGVTVAAIMNFYKISPSDLIVIHDDLDILIGKYKVSRDTHAVGHNGVQSIIDMIGTQDFMRIRIGIETTGGKKERGQISGEAYVLQDFLPEEQKMLDPVCDAIISDVFSAL